MKKHFSLLFAALFLALTLFPATALADSTPAALSTVTGSTLPDGAFYAISSEADLAKLAELVNGGEDCAGNSFILTSKIILSEDHNGADAGLWVPIGSGTFSMNPSVDTTGHPFNGTFYGQNHYISDMDSQVTYCSGLFGYIGSSGIVMDLKVSGNLYEADCAGGIAAINQGKVINCENNVSYFNRTTTPCSIIGGVVGANQGTVQNCRNYGPIIGYKGASNGDTSIGGVVGTCKDNATVISCFNAAYVGGWSNIGGVVGDTHSEYLTYIRNCYNYGSVVAEDVCGGIVGILNNNSRLYNCYNEGTVTAHTSWYSGAIAGMIGFSCLVEHNYYLQSSFSQPYGDADSTDFVTIAFTGSNTLLATASPWGTFSLVEALNGYVEDESSIPLRSWMSDGSTPYHTGTVLMSNPEDVATSVGLNGVFRVIAVGDNITYQWQVSTDGSSWSDLSSGYGFNSPLYITPALTAEMNGSQYRCLIDGTLQSGSAKLLIAAAPVITTQPVDAYAKVGDPISVSISATGSPSPRYSWDYSLNGIDWYPMADEDSEVGTDTMAAEIDGLYLRCVVYNSLGRVTSNIARMYIATAPSITTQPSDKTAAVGKTATFSAAATGGPAPTYQWQINRGSGWSDISGANEASYTTAKTELLNDGYQYRVIATNIAGEATSDAAKLSVVKDAEVPTTGDTAHPVLWAAFGLLSLCGLCALALTVKKRRA